MTLSSQESEKDLPDPNNKSGLTQQPGAYYWINIDSQNKRISAGVGEPRQETQIYSYTFTTENINLESLLDIHYSSHVQPLRLLRDPILQNVPLIVRSTEDLTMDEVASNKYLPHANLSSVAQKLYNCISGTRFVLDDDAFPEFSQAIEHSIRTPGCWCYERLLQKSTEFNPGGEPKPKETYLRITLGQNNGESPGVPYVMEIWPVGHYSPIHSHSAANAVIRVLHGSINVSLFPFLCASKSGVEPFAVANFNKADITWISPTLNQTHQLRNLESNKDTCITIQCYKYDEEDNQHYDYFDYIDDDGKQQKYTPDSDMDFVAFKQLMRKEYLEQSSSHSLPLHNKHVRRSITELKHHPAEFGRFCMALQNLQKSEDWFRICGIHGNTFKPNDTGVLCPTDPSVVEKIAETGEPVYCKHRVHSFIAWHAPYLYQFELLLNKYNTSRNKHYIALPWLDLTDTTQDLSFLNDPILTIEFDGTSMTIENPLATANYYDLSGNCVKIQRNGYLKPVTHEQKATIKTLRKQLISSQYATTYEEFSSHPVSQITPEVGCGCWPTTTNKSLYEVTALETPHNTVHDIIGGEGGNMSDISISAFDPLFWLHHANMDRHYYNWMYRNTESFSRPLHPNKQILKETLAMTHAPFSDGIYDRDPNSYKYGWMNSSCKFHTLKDSLELQKFPYTYELITLPAMKPSRSTAFIDILNMPVPPQSTLIKAYLVPEGRAIIHETDFAGSVVWLGLDRSERHCSRCEVARIDLRIDIEDYCKSHNITQKTKSKWLVVIEAVGRNKPAVYTQKEILQDAKLILVL